MFITNKHCGRISDQRLVHAINIFEDQKKHALVGGHGGVAQSNIYNYINSVIECKYVADFSYCLFIVYNL
jgi:hypothetical protein